MIINKKDNVEVDLATGHKKALKDIADGEKIIKYGYPIGVATAPIKKGEAVHTHNFHTGLSGISEYSYTPDFACPAKNSTPTFYGYLRKDGKAGIRNEIWIIPTVGCVNGIAKEIERRTGAYAFTHPFGCSQLGGDMETTQKILRGLINNANAGGVLVLGLGCENNNIGVFKKVLGDIDSDRVKFLECQNSDDEIERGCEIIEELKKYAARTPRTEIGLDKLTVGLKCGGSDGYSGITANPLVGHFCDKLTSVGGSSIMSEVPEMFGAETVLMSRCTTKETFDKLVNTVNGYKKYFLSHGQEIYENPSPGNKAGGITTLEEKSLGCITKGGTAPVVDMLDFGEQITKNGLNLLNGPGNDIVACTNLAASGCTLILFTTGRGTPLGSPVPTVKISTNSALAGKKKNWIDFDAGRILAGENLDDEFFSFVVKTANGALTKNEINGYREISIFKDGVIL